MRTQRSGRVTLVGWVRIRRRGHLVLAGLLAVLVVVSCGEGPRSSGSGSTDLNASPVALDEHATISGLSHNRLFVMNDRKAAIYDFGGGGWRSLPDIPFAASGITSIDDHVILLGPECDGKCDPDKDVPLIGASLDASSDDEWSTKRLDVRPTEPRFSQPSSIGRIGHEQILGARDLFAIDADLNTRSISSPAENPYQVCATPQGLTALTSTVAVEVNATPPINAVIGPDGNALVTAAPGVGEAWESIEGSETSRIPLISAAAESPNDVSTTSLLSGMCSANGLLMATRLQTMEWDGNVWRTYPSGPADAVTRGSWVRTDSGSIAAADGRGSLNVFSNGSWRSVRVTESTPGAPPLQTIAAVGDRVVVLNVQPGERGTLSVVELTS